MCELSDYEHLRLTGGYWDYLLSELDGWHDYYLPIPEGGTILDIGAGCGESALFYLLHGAGRVIAVESDDEAFDALCSNFADDPRVMPIHAHVDKVKMDAEGAEQDMDLEVHFPFAWQVMRVAGPPGGQVWQMRLTAVV